MSASSLFLDITTSSAIAKAKRCVLISLQLFVLGQCLMIAKNGCMIYSLVSGQANDNKSLTAKLTLDFFFTANKPIAIQCPVAGKFKFVQSGEIPFENRILGGVTDIPITNVYCKEKISDFSVCDSDRKKISIDTEYCLDVDSRGNPVDYQSKPDYVMDCIGYWKENLKSYLITHDRSDAYSKYRCWVYQRNDLNRVLMSMSVGAFCHIKQDVRSNSSAEGAQVALNMIEFERERKHVFNFYSKAILNQNFSLYLCR